MADIARHAGVNPVSIFNRFGSKAALVKEALLELAKRQWEGARSIIQAEGSFLDRFERLIRYKTDEAGLRDPELLRAALSGDPSLAAELQAMFRDEVNPAMEAFLAEGREEGQIRSDISPEVLDAYLGMFFDMARARPELFDSRERAERTAKEVWSLLLRGLAG